MVRSSLCSGAHEVEEHWSMDDLVEAHAVLDMEDELATKKAKAEADEAKRLTPPRS